MFYKKFGVQSPPTPKNWLVSWSNDKELSSGADAIDWNSLSKKKKDYEINYSLLN